MKHLLFILIATCVLCSCKSQKIVATAIESDSTTISRTVTERVRVDSIHNYVRDSIFIRVAGDTVLVERWHTKYISKIHTDTLRTGDTIYIAKNIIEKEREIVEVKKPLKWWQKTLMWTGGILLFILFILFLIGIKKVVKW